MLCAFALYADSQDAKLVVAPTQATQTMTASMTAGATSSSTGEYLGQLSMLSTH